MYNINVFSIKTYVLTIQNLIIKEENRLFIILYFLMLNVFLLIEFIHVI